VITDAVEEGGSAVSQVNERASIGALCVGSECSESFKYSDFSFAQVAIAASSEKSHKIVSVGKGSVLTRFWVKIKTLIHKGDQSLPTVKVEIPGQGSQVVEEGASDSEFAADSLIHQTAEVQDAMKEKGQNQEG
jgi:hypothetical protein